MAAITLCACTESEILTSTQEINNHALTFGINRVNTQSRADYTEIDMEVLRFSDMGVLGLKRDSSITDGGYEYVCNNTRMTPTPAALLWEPNPVIGINKAKDYSFLTYGPYDPDMESNVWPDSGIVSLKFPMCQMVDNGAIDYVISQPIQDYSGDLDWVKEQRKSRIPMSMYHALCRVTLNVCSTFTDGRRMFLQGGRIFLPDTTKKAELRCNLATGESYYIDTAYNFLDTTNLYSEYSKQFDGDGVELISGQVTCELFDFYIAPLRDETKTTKIKVELDLMITYSDPNTAPDYITTKGEIPVIVTKNTYYATNTQMHRYVLTFEGDSFKKLKAIPLSSFVDFKQ